MNINMKSGTVSINGRSYTGTSVSIKDGKVIVDGKPQDGAPLAGPISVQVMGDCNLIECGSGDVTVSGTVRGDVKTISGDVRCGDVGGGIQAISGNVNCGHVAGSTHTVSGNINKK